VIVGGAGLAAVAIAALLAWRLPRRAYVLVRGQHRAHAQAEQLRREAEAVQALTADLSSSSTVDDVHAAIAKTGPALLGADAVTIGLLDDERNSIDVWSSELSSGASVPGELVPAADHPGAEVVRSGRARFVERVGSPGSPFASLAVLPLAAPGEQPRGYLGLHYLREHELSESEKTRIRVVAAQVETALFRAETHERDRRAAEALQRALLPASLPSSTEARVVGYYRPGSAGALVGGDWYDALEHDDGTIAGTVGDVAGQGIAAATQMGRLRHSYRAYALEHCSPAEILARLTRHIGADAMATAVCFDLDPHTGLLRYCSAGHPPPVLFRPNDRSTVLLDTLRAPPLGAAAPADFVDTTVRLQGRTILFAYTDGLVEERTIDITERIQTLAAHIAATSVDDLDDRVAAVVAAMGGDEGNPDDLAILAVDLRPGTVVALEPARRRGSG
jgi:serine phosphatase RsbU (regulator of sigma subunit)